MGCLAVGERVGMVVGSECRGGKTLSSASLRPQSSAYGRSTQGPERA